METAAQVLLALIAVGIARAYINGGWPAVDRYWRAKLLGLDTPPGDFGAGGSFGGGDFTPTPTPRTATGGKARAL